MEVSRLISSSSAGVDPARVARLVRLLEVDPTWNLTTVSDGQRRRVQILCKLIKPFKVLLLDEITTDLDLLARHELLAFLREESEERGVTILCTARCHRSHQPALPSCLDAQRAHALTLAARLGARHARGQTAPTFSTASMGGRRTWRTSRRARWSSVRPRTSSATSSSCPLPSRRADVSRHSTACVQPSKPPAGTPSTSTRATSDAASVPR
jgi:hypothetical protein